VNSLSSRSHRNCLPHHARHERRRPPPPTRPHPAKADGAAARCPAVRLHESRVRGDSSRRTWPLVLATRIGSGAARRREAAQAATSGAAPWPQPSAVRPGGAAPRRPYPSHKARAAERRGGLRPTTLAGGRETPATTERRTPKPRRRERCRQASNPLPWQESQQVREALHKTALPELQLNDPRPLRPAARRVRNESGHMRQAQAIGDQRAPGHTQPGKLCPSKTARRHIQRHQNPGDANGAAKRVLRRRRQPTKADGGAPAPPPSITSAPEDGRAPA